jgi:hypothetical protein
LKAWVSAPDRRPAERLEPSGLVPVRDIGTSCSPAGDSKLHLVHAVCAFVGLGRSDSAELLLECTQALRFC